MKNKLKTKKSLKYKKNNRKSRKILIGGENPPITQDKYKLFLDKRIKETYSFLSCIGGDCDITKQPTDTTEKYEFDINPDYTTYDINYNYNYEENPQKYELYYPDYHGSHETKDPVELEDNFYLCIFGFFDTSSLIIPNKWYRGLMNFTKFFKNMSKKDFNIICKYKSLLSSPELKHKLNIRNFSNAEGSTIMDCFLKASWVFPNQKYYDISFTMEGGGEKDKPLVKSYHNKYNNSKSEIEKTNLKNSSTITGIKSFISYIKNNGEYLEGNKYIIFVDSCRPNFIGRKEDRTEQLTTNIIEIAYRNQSLNYAIYKSQYPSFEIGSEDYNTVNKLKYGLCSSDLNDYKYIFISPKNSVLSDKHIHFMKSYTKNDNLHPLIPKLRYLYDILLTIAPGDIERYFKNNFDNLYFIITLSFNKLRKFLVKLKTKSPVICDSVIQCIKNNKKCMKIWTYYNTSYKNMLDKYNAWSDSYANVYHNFKICSFIFDFLELSYLFNNSNIHSRQITQIQKTPFSTLFSLEDYIIEPTNVIHRSEIVRIIGYIFNPFILPIYNKKLFSNVTVFEAVNCSNFENKFTFDFISFNKLQSLNIDDTAFAFRGVGPIKDLNYILTKCFHQNMEDINAKEIKINNFMLPPEDSQTEEIINFVNFKIISLNFRENDITYNTLPEIHIKNSKEIELIKFGNCSFNKHIIIDKKNVDKVHCFSINNQTTFRKPITISDTDINCNMVGLELSNIFFTNKLFYNQSQIFSGLSVLKLYNLNETVTFSTELKLKKIEVLEIVNCNLENIFFHMTEIRELSLINTSIISKDNDINEMLIKCINNLKINIVDCNPLNFNLYIKDKIKNSDIDIKNSSLLNTIAEEIKIGKINYYKLCNNIKLSGKLSKYMEKRKNKIHILGVDL